MKKIASIIAAVLVLLTYMLLLTAMLVGCNYGNYAVGNSKHYDFDYAVVRWPDGTVETIEIRSWRDYDGEQIQITDVMGNTYVVNSVNCVLVDEYMEEYQEQEEANE